jgi:hypothetical protein
VIAALVTLALVQGARVDAAFVIRVDSEDVARETATFTRGRLASGSPGWTVTATTRYDRVRPGRILVPTLEIAADSTPTTLQFDVTNPVEPVRILGQLSRDRYTVRTVAKSFERAREFPVQPPLVVLDDSVVALYQVAAWFARPNPVTVTAIVPRGPRREQLTIADAGSDGRLRRVTVSGGANARVDLWLDESGALVRLAIPSRRLVAARLPTD